MKTMRNKKATAERRDIVVAPDVVLDTYGYARYDTLRVSCDTFCTKPDEYTFL